MAVPPSVSSRARQNPNPAMLDLLITHATLADGRRDMSIAVQDGKIAEVAPGLDAPAHETVDAQGQLLSAPFVLSLIHI